jgi:hypothetical protein
LLDSTSDFRARTCVQLFTSEGIDETSDSVRIEVLKPYRAQALAGERCENDRTQDTVKVQVQSNITSVNYYTSHTALDIEGEFRLPQDVSLDFPL